MAGDVPPDLLALLDELDQDELTEAVAGLSPDALQAVLAAMGGAGTLPLPDGPAGQAAQLEPSYVLRAHVSYLSDRLARAVADVEGGRDRRMLISMPPRSGKSTLVSLFTVVWLLRKHPDWSFILTSHDSGLATTWGRSIQQHVLDGKGALGVELARNPSAAGEWATTAGGSVLSRGIRGSITGRGAKVLIIDDPVKDFVDAHSPIIREATWNWWLSTSQPRLEPPSLVLVVMCMTGDTPVLRPDGTETPLRDIRPGDEVATYEDGSIAVATVRDQRSQGEDDILAVRMESGRVVRANARHPFLTVTGTGETAWTRADQLSPGTMIMAAGAAGGASAAGRTGASPRPSAKDSARRTTTRPGGLRAIALPRSTPALGALLESSTATALRSMSTRRSSLFRTDDARFVENGLPPRTPPPTGRANSASTTTTGPGGSGDFSATTATSSSGGAPPRPYSALRPTTWSPAPDTVLSVEPAGRAEVYDLQVDRTENFIASGLVSHNTRWHEDDFAGRLLSKDHEGDPGDWEVVRLPALADDPDDVLGRDLGAPLLSPLLPGENAEGAVGRWGDIRRSVGSYAFASMYQQRPAPAKGTIFNADWWRFWTVEPRRATDDGLAVLLDPADLAGGRWLDSWDFAFKGKSDSDFVVGQRWARYGANRYLIAQQRGRWTFTETIERMEHWAGPDDPAINPYGRLVQERLMEEAANGAAILDVLRERVPGMVPLTKSAGKEVYARAVTPEIEAGRVYLPHPADPGNGWVMDLLGELRNFPHDTNDDQVDALTQALLAMRDAGKGRITVPGRGSRTITGDRAAAAASDPLRRRGIR